MEAREILTANPLYKTAIRTSNFSLIIKVVRLCQARLGESKLKNGLCTRDSGGDTYPRSSCCSRYSP